MHHREGRFAAHDGLPLARQSWLPAGKPRAAVVLVHGIFEHSGRYAALGRRLADEGYAVHAYDHRGHGRSPGPRGMIWRFDHLVADLDRFLRTLCKEAAHDEVACGGERLAPFLLGHSLGGVTVARWVLGRSDGAQGLILSAPSLQIRDTVFPLLRRAAHVMSAVAPRLRLVRLGYTKISRDATVVQAFRDDPLVYRGRFPIRTGAEVLQAAGDTLRRAGEVRLPLLILQGTADALADPAGAQTLFDRAASADKTLRRYEGLYHEVFSEPEREQVMCDLLQWLAARDGC